MKFSSPGRRAAAVLAALTALAGLFWFAFFGADDAPRRVPVLLYHSISETPVGVPSLSVTPEEFEAQMRYLAENGYTAIGLDELGRCGGYKKPVVITFDDGYADNYTNAYPILKRWGMKATVFMVSGYVGRGGYLSVPQIRAMEDLVSFQSHTASHLRLDRMSLSRVRRECAVSKADLSRVTGRPVYALSYPNGSFSTLVRETVSDYYRCAVTTLPGGASPGVQTDALRRTYVLRGDSLHTFAAKLAMR